MLRWGWGWGDGELGGEDGRGERSKGDGSIVAVAGRARALGVQLGADESVKRLEALACRCLKVGGGVQRLACAHVYV